MSLQDEKRKVLANLMNHKCSVEDALMVIACLEVQQYAGLVAGAEYVVEDFDTFGEVLQADEEGEYGPDTPIECLRAGLKIANNS